MFEEILEKIGKTIGSVGNAYTSGKELSKAQKEAAIAVSKKYKKSEIEDKLKLCENEIKLMLEKYEIYKAAITENKGTGVDINSL